MKKTISILILSFAVASLTAQQATEDQSKLKITSFGSSMGFSGTYVSNTTGDYNSLAGNVEDPGYFVNAGRYDESKYNYGFGGNGNLQFYLGLTPYCKKRGEYRNDRELRINFGFSFGARRTFSYFHRNTFLVDSYQSNSGSMVYADSSKFTRMNYAESYYGVGLGLAYLFKTNPERRFHFYTGLGMEYSLALRSFVRINEYNESTFYYYTQGNRPVLEEPDFEWMGFRDDDGNSSSTTTNMNGNLMFIRPYIPLGVNFRITNQTRSFFNHVNLFMEINPGIEFQLVGNEETYINPYLGVAMMGFTYRW